MPKLNIKFCIVQGFDFVFYLWKNDPFRILIEKHLAMVGFMDTIS